MFNSAFCKNIKIYAECSQFYDGVTATLRTDSHRLSKLLQTVKSMTVRRTSGGRVGGKRQTVRL